MTSVERCYRVQPLKFPFEGFVEKFCSGGNIRVQPQQVQYQLGTRNSFWQTVKYRQTQVAASTHSFHPQLQCPTIPYNDLRCRPLSSKLL
jgi:hypothetical protein